MYQIFSYVKNLDKKRTGNVSGMLLYAKTNEEITPNNDFRVSGNRFSVRTLNLNSEFHQIASQLNEIALEFFGGVD
jgi:5-methylcytosine-specific restriction enzyme subunit McrC